MKAYISVRPSYLALMAALLLNVPAHAQWRRPPTVPMQVGANPVSAADIVGRDLDMIGLGGVGHVGIWTGNLVIEALNTSGNAINTNSLFDFKSRTRYWGAVFVDGLEKMPSQRMCTDASCSYLVALGMKEAIIQNALVIKQIGADYTVADGYISALPACSPPACASYRRPVRGLYRCDKFVVDAFAPLSNVNLELWNVMSRTNRPSMLFSSFNERGVVLQPK
ncbi:hypothetical protein VSR17_23560 [Cupriavidus taiwanensis]|uniref:hypothetical protein n=1 Tax=Cupriavidus taiwanensis TaxID=164546 RepID=UPI000E185FF8|nr:hypothetical protein [Cupriavidus taiwanensis]SOZ24550.1 exported hypothetical protein [Cupriavidus taiwanensis]SPA29420.1 exported hypothetical protein [Cupriavidus taiwanensis]